MIPILGIVVVFVSVIGGFLMENGKMGPLVQPAELVIIIGTAVGTLLSANPIKLLKRTWRELMRVFRGSRPDGAFYLKTLVMLHALFEYARRNGATKLEDQLDNPERSVVFRRHATVIRNEDTLNFLCDTLRLTTLGQISQWELDAMLEQDADIREHDLAAPAGVLNTLADALPGLGIISAVLGVVITMSALRESPKTIGHKIGAALVGTFLGIFLSYGFAAPLAAHVERLNETEIHYFNILRVAMAAFARGMPVQIALEFGRRAIPPTLRPGFIEMEQACRQSSGKIVEMPP
jgi:chemotaxis protein MotA